MDGSNNADIEDMMYADVGEALAEMAAEHRVAQDAKAAAQADRDAKKAEAAEAAELAEAQSNRELCERPLEACTKGPGSNAPQESVTLLNKPARKRKEREAMTEAERVADDERKAEHKRKTQQGKANAKARREREAEEAKKPPKKLLRPRQEVVDDLTLAHEALKKATLFSKNGANDDAYSADAVECQALEAKVACLQEELERVDADMKKRAIASGSGSSVGIACAIRLWWPEGVEQVADFRRIKKDDDLRAINIMFKQEADRRKEAGEEGTEVYKCVAKTLGDLRAEGKRRLHATAAFKKEAKAKAKADAMDARQQRAIDEYDNWEKILVSASDRKWWHEEGYYRAMEKHFPNANVFKPEAIETINEAQVETEEM